MFVPNNISVPLSTKAWHNPFKDWIYSSRFSLIWSPVKHTERAEILMCCNIYSFSYSQINRLALLVLGLQRYAQWACPRKFVFCFSVRVWERRKIERERERQNKTSLLFFLCKRLHSFIINIDKDVLFAHFCVFCCFPRIESVSVFQAFPSLFLGHLQWRACWESRWFVSGSLKE